MSPARSLLLLPLGLALAAAPLRAGQHSLLEADAAAAGLGGCAAFAQGPAALYSGPAGLDGARSPELTLSHLAWIGDTSLDSLAYAQPLGSGALGLAVDSFRILPFDSTEGAQPSFEAGQLSLRGGWAAGLRWGRSRWQAGAALRYASFSDGGSLRRQQSAADLSLSGLALLGGRVDLAAGVQHLALGDGADLLPQALRLGAALRLAPGLRLEAQLLRSEGQAETGLGAEWALGSRAALRGGLNVPANGEPPSYSAGLGARAGGLQVDVALRNTGPLGYGLWGALSTRFGFNGAEAGEPSEFGLRAVQREAPPGPPVPPASAPRPAPRAGGRPPDARPLDDEWERGEFELSAVLDGRTVQLDWPAREGATYSLGMALLRGGSFHTLEPAVLHSPAFRQPLQLPGLTYYFRALLLGPDGAVLARSRPKAVLLPRGAP